MAWVEAKIVSVQTVMVEARSSDPQGALDEAYELVMDEFYGWDDLELKAVKEAEVESYTRHADKVFKL